MSIIVENLPYIGAGVGVVTGAATEFFAVRNAEHNREALSSVLEGIQDERISLPRRIGRSLRSPLVFGVAGLCAFTGHVWQPEDVIETPPDLHVLVDHSGATVGGEVPALSTIDKLVQSLGEADSFESSFTVARLGKAALAEDAEAVTKLRPMGGAPLDLAFDDAIGATKEKQFESVGQKPNKAAIAVITNGNTFGDQADVVARAVQTGTPVYIANVEGKKSVPKSVEALKAISKATKGTYWDVTKDTAEEMVEQINNTLEEDGFAQEKSDKWPLRAIAAISLVGTVFLGFRKRSDMTLANNLVIKGGDK